MAGQLGLDASADLYAGSQPLPRPVPTPDRPVNFRPRKTTRDMTGLEAFSFASELIARRNFAAAAPIFDRLAGDPALVDRAKIMLAVCQGGMGRHALALDALRRAFSCAEPDLAAAIFRVIFPTRSAIAGHELQELARAVNNHVPGITRTSTRYQRLWCGEFPGHTPAAR